MKNIIILHDPGISSFNIGDEIISDSIRYEISNITKMHTVLSVSTHLPLAYRYMRLAKNPLYQFVCGSNLLKSSFFGIKRQWDITLRKSFYTRNCIFIGVGAWQYNNKMNFYTKFLLKRTLSSSYIHSVRDEYTKEIMYNMGFKNVINTGCASMWRFTPEFCKQIPQTKHKNVVFTLTDYDQNIEKDSRFIEILMQEYDNVYFFPQGAGDIDYIKRLGYIERVVVIEPSLKSYDEFLKRNIDIDYVGTRLHGGIRALQFKRRALIISIDNRAREKSKNFNLPVLERNEIEKLDSILNNNIEYRINIPIDNINKWKKQFSDEIK